MSDKIIRVNFKKNADPNYFNLVNNSPFSREYYARVAGGTSSSMKNVSRQQILALPVAIPPLVEQHRIVAKVEQLMALCDALEAKLNHARQQSEKLVEASVRQLLVA
jgi:type I restriction enzyme S subunit